jgi:hypothetical protein
MMLGLHLGHQNVRGNPSAVSYTDWKIGLSKTFDEAPASPWAWPMSVPTSRTASTTPASDGSKNVGKNGVSSPSAKLSNKRFV